MHQKAEEIKQDMILNAAKEVAVELDKYPDEEIVNAVGRHVKIKVKIF